MVKQGWGTEPKKFAHCQITLSGSFVLQFQKTESDKATSVFHYPKHGSYGNPFSCVSCSPNTTMASKLILYVTNQLDVGKGMLPSKELNKLDEVVQSVTVHCCLCNQMVYTVYAFQFSGVPQSVHFAAGMAIAAGV